MARLLSMSLVVAVAAVLTMSFPAFAVDGADPDHDGIPTSWEHRLGLDAHDPDTDGDGTRDGDEDPDRDRLTDRFEIHRSHTDPRAGDTDRDGVRDGAEDPDHDQVSNAGEALLGTQPNQHDSDHDGRDDWHEDADDDGLRNGREQDQRAMPARLRSELPTILSERPSSYSDGCHAETGDIEARPCSYGDLDSETTVMLLGDSHAAHWLAAFADIAMRRHWHLYVLTKSGCPVPEVSHLVRPGEVAEDCNLWRADAFALIDDLHPDLVVAASRMDYHLEGSWERDTNRNRSIWRAGMVRSLRRLKASAHKVVLLGDVPHWSPTVAACLVAAKHRNDVGACAVLRSHAYDQVRLDLDKSAARQVGVAYRSTNGLTCPYDPCTPVIDKWLITFDGSHITRRYAELVSRGIQRLLPTLSD